MLPMVVVIVMMKILVPKLKATIMVWNWWNILICAKSYPSNYDNIPGHLVGLERGLPAMTEGGQVIMITTVTCGVPMTMTMTLTEMWCDIGHVACHDNENDGDVMLHRTCDMSWQWKWQVCDQTPPVIWSPNQSIITPHMQLKSDPEVCDH